MLPFARLLLAVLFVATVGLAGCKPKIGDACTTSTDCSVNGDRLCDVTQPSGYCTQFNCEPDGCPEGEAICVAFGDMVCGTVDVRRRFARTFCMATCDNDSDCRAGYQCRDVGNEVVDTAPPTHRVCMVVGGTAPMSSPDAAPMSMGATVCDAGPLSAWDAPVTETPDSASDSPDAVSADGASEAAADTDAPTEAEASSDAEPDTAADGSETGPDADAGGPDGDASTE